MSKKITESILSNISGKSKRLTEMPEGGDSPMGLLGQVLDTATSMGWSYDEIDYSNNEGGYEFYQYSPAGEDFSFTACYGSKDLSDDEKGKNLIADIESYYDNYDPEEHAELWIEGRGQNGAPSSIRALLDDADAIDGMLKELSDELTKINHPMNESYQYNWRDDIEDLSDSYNEENDQIFYEVAENMVENGDYQGYDVYEVMSDIIGLWKISKRSRLYKYLLKWYGSEEKLLANVRDVLDKNDAIYFVTGCGYSLFDKDLLGGNADGTTARKFDAFVDKEEGLTESIESKINKVKAKKKLKESGNTLSDDKLFDMLVNSDKFINIVKEETGIKDLTSTSPEVGDRAEEWISGNIEGVYDLLGIKEGVKVKLTEAPSDDISRDEEEYELATDEEAPVEEPLPEEPTGEEMTDTEYEEEAEDDAKETVKDDIEEPFYATTPEFDELREVLPDLDYRLFLINDNMVCIGRLNGPDIEFLTSNTPNVKDDAEVSDANDKAEEVEERAEENEEDSFEYLWIKAPDSFDKFVNQVNVVYLSPEMSDEDKEQYAGIEASHESVMEYLMNELPEDKRKEIEKTEEPTEDVPVEEPTEVVPELPAEEEPIEEAPEEEEDKEEEK